MQTLKFQIGWRGILLPSMPMVMSGVQKMLGMRTALYPCRVLLTMTIETAVGVGGISVRLATTNGTKMQCTKVFCLQIVVHNTRISTAAIGTRLKYLAVVGRKNSAAFILFVGRSFSGRNTKLSVKTMWLFPKRFSKWWFVSMANQRESVLYVETARATGKKIFIPTLSTKQKGLRA